MPDTATPADLPRCLAALYVLAKRDDARNDLHAALRAGDVKQVRALMVVHRRAFTREMQGEVEVWLADRGDLG